MIDLACDRPGCHVEAHTKARSGGVDGWFAAFVDGRRINACGIAHLQPALTFADPGVVCGNTSCRNPSGRDHFYCTEQCRDQEQRNLVGMSTIWGSPDHANTIAVMKQRLTSLPAGAY